MYCTIDDVFTTAQRIASHANRYSDSPRNFVNITAIGFWIAFESETRSGTQRNFSTQEGRSRMSHETGLQIAEMARISIMINHSDSTH